MKDMGEGEEMSTMENAISIAPVSQRISRGSSRRPVRSSSDVMSLVTTKVGWWEPSKLVRDSWQRESVRGRSQ